MSKKKQDWVDWVKTIVITIIVVFIVRLFVAVPIVVDGPSMLPTLIDKDRLIVNKIGLMFSDPDRFDVVVFHATAKEDYIKRVIGLPGDSIAYQDDQLYINNEPVAEPFIEQEITNEQFNYTTNFTMQDIPGNEEVVPDGHVFVLGDNRPDSTDSRHIGFVPIDQIEGVASLTYWPLDDIGLVR